MASATVVLVPPPSRRQNTAIYKTARTNPEGNFTISAVPLGEYKLFAWENVPATAYMNAEFMAKYESLGKPVTVATGLNPASMQLNVIPIGLAP